jgi:hypothetical protein
LYTPILNKVPLLDFFDDSLWKINNQIARKTTLSEVKSKLGGNYSLNDKNELHLKDQNNTLILKFSYSRDHESYEKLFTLADFTLKANSYKKNQSSVKSERTSQFKLLTEMLWQLEHGQKIDSELLIPQLGRPLVKILLSADSNILVYNSNLYIKTAKLGLKSISFVEANLSDEPNKAIKVIPWFLGNYVQGKTTDQLRSFFPEGAFELDNKVEIDSDYYHISLFFDDLDGFNRLYEAEVVLY